MLFIATFENLDTAVKLRDVLNFKMLQCKSVKIQIQGVPKNLLEYGEQYIVGSPFNKHL